MSDTTRDWKIVLSEHASVINEMTARGETIERIIDGLIACFHAGCRVYILGNGGSAADAQHIAAELLGRFKLNRRALPAMALTTDSSALTAISNDIDFDHVFSRQLEGLVAPGDVVWILSTSGNSPNVLEAARVAAQRGAVVVGFTGAGGGKLAELCTHALCVPHDSSDRIQEAHCLAYHYICERVEAALA